VSSARPDTESSTHLQRQRLVSVHSIPHALSSARSSHEAVWTSSITKQLGSTFLCWYGLKTNKMWWWLCVMCGVNRITYWFQGVASLPHKCQPPLPSDRQHPSYGDCLEVKGEYYQNCSVLGCVTQCSRSAAHLHEQFLHVQQIGFVTLGPLCHA